LREELDRCLALTEALKDTKETATIHTFSGKFENGFEIDLKVCNGDTGPWIDLILFDEGTEVCADAPDPEGGLLGEFELYDGEDTYRLFVEEEHNGKEEA
jgi:hypothetical protein